MISRWRKRKVGVSMFVGRKNELAKLNDVYGKDGLPVVILYGREGMGKTTLAREFGREKEYVTNSEFVHFE